MSSPPNAAGSPSRTPPQSPARSTHSRGPSVQHVPTVPSRLREATNMSPEERHAPIYQQSDSSDTSEQAPAALDPSTSETTTGEFFPPVNGDSTEAEGFVAEPTQIEQDERTRLLETYHDPRVCGLRNCNHGTFSPRPESVRSYTTSSMLNGFGGTPPEPGAPPGGYRAAAHAILGDSIIDTLSWNKSRSTTKQLASAKGVKGQRWMYLTYYFPFLRWITQYRMSWFQGDLIAALTMASFYIPMSLSYAANLGHIPPVNGLYAFVFNPLVYALLGTCPQMVVGPEAAGSLLVGQVVRECIDRGSSNDDASVLNAQIAGVVTSLAGAVILVAGLTRLGFLDSVLSRPFLRGFISAIGFVILVDQAIPELGLKAHKISHGSSWDKIVFIFQKIHKTHKLTAAVSFSAFAIIMVFRQLKKKMQPRYPSMAYFPDRFLVVVLSAILAWKYEWNKQGLALLGDVKAGEGSGIPFHWPLATSHVKHIDTALGTSVLIALLGFFESSVAAKSLGEGTSELKGMNLSANRDLVALGTANIIGGCFMALPAFGGYGRSKINASTGGTTPMSSIFLSLISLFCVAFLLPYFYWLPKGVLSAMISVVAYSLIEEAPHDIKFFIKIRGWSELALMFVIFLSTIFYSLSVGIALGISLSLLAVIKHAAKPRIQILGRVQGQPNRFENAESAPDQVEHIEGALIVKIPEPLTFANTGDMRTRLRRLEQYGTNKAHPSLPRVRHEEHNRNVIFDVHGVTSIDGSGTQVLAEIVKAYVDRGARVIFCRLPHRRTQVYSRFEDSGIVEMCGGPRYFVSNVDEALKLSEAEDLSQYFEERLRSSPR
ncbi:hypothetical protein PMZ80_003649 [Knufia obscura]|uniref:STAS domain-containing protein n=1 Tax=Knufia obscura TaxID=1635080 RepID=A0ABR0RUU4_9EURO|nr:hypothetical protein PMZ80_003649 [Knufia obscura]